MAAHGEMLQRQLGSAEVGELWDSVMFRLVAGTWSSFGFCRCVV